MPPMANRITMLTRTGFFSRFCFFEGFFSSGVTVYGVVGVLE
jgi:hypothetical protein